MIRLLFCTLFVIYSSASAHAHFLTLTASSPTVSSSAPLTLSVSFRHPFEGSPLALGKPESAFDLHKGKRTPLSSFQVVEKSAGAGISISYPTLRPGDHTIVVRQSPYFEASEQKFIRQEAKVVIGAHGMEDGWHLPAGLPVEIVPLTRPYGLWTGNIFTGQVLVDGKPAAGMTVEIENLANGKLKAPDESMITQTVITDAKGYFSYAIPFSGWWGFAAITDKGTMKGKDGKSYPLEQGGVIWIYAFPAPAKAGK